MPWSLSVGKRKGGLTSALSLGSHLSKGISDVRDAPLRPCENRACDSHTNRGPSIDSVGFLLGGHVYTHAVTRSHSPQARALHPGETASQARRFSYQPRSANRLGWRVHACCHSQPQSPSESFTPSAIPSSRDCAPNRGRPIVSVGARRFSYLLRNGRIVPEEAETNRWAVGR